MDTSVSPYADTLPTTVSRCGEEIFFRMRTGGVRSPETQSICMTYDLRISNGDLPLPADLHAAVAAGANFAAAPRRRRRAAAPWRLFYAIETPRTRMFPPDVKSRCDTAVSPSG